MSTCVSAYRNTLKMLSIVKSVDWRIMDCEVIDSTV